MIPIYEESLASGVSDWSWTNTDHASTSQVFEGNYALYGELNGYEGIYLGFQPAIDVPPDGYLEFSVYSESSVDLAIRTSSVEVGDVTPVFNIVAANQWQQESVAVADLGIQGSIWGVWWQQYSDQPSGGVYLDNIRITSAASEPPDEPNNSGNPDPTGPFSTAGSTSRFLSRATFGATASDIDRLVGTFAADYGNGSAVIPRQRSAVDEFYPGTELALTEYHFGGANTGVGGLAQIDALGIFGREGLDMATLWEPYADFVTTPPALFSDIPVFGRSTLRRCGISEYIGYSQGGGVVAGYYSQIFLLTKSTSKSASRVAATETARRSLPGCSESKKTEWIYVASGKRSTACSHHSNRLKILATNRIAVQGILTAVSDLGVSCWQIHRNQSPH